MSPTTGRLRLPTLAAIILLLCSSGCKKNSSTEPIIEPDPSYTPLNVGDIQQLVNLADSLTFFREIIGTAKRTDGTGVFHMVDWWGVDTLHSYWFVRDGFLIATDLDTLSNYQRDPKNPFREQRLARSYPQQGESWKTSPGTHDTDIFFADYRSAVKTECGIFARVCAFVLQPRFAGDTLCMIPHYAPGVGYIGTDLNNDHLLDVSVAYSKVGGREYGKPWPVKWPKNGLQNMKSIHRIIGLQ